MTVSSSLKAHSENDNGQWHTLSDHLESVARIAELFASSFDGNATARIAGLLHDAGKSRPEFQQLLAGLRNRSDETHHSKYGAALAASLNDNIAALSIAGHHEGLPDLSNLKSTVNQCKTERSDSLKNIEHTLHQMFPEFKDVRPSSPSYLKAPLNAEFFTRMIFSTLVDADWLDTERHFKGDIRSLAWPLLERLSERFFDKQRAFQDENTGATEGMNL